MRPIRLYVQGYEFIIRDCEGAPEIVEEGRPQVDADREIFHPETRVTLKVEYVE